jgi:hypothetical protein
MAPAAFADDSVRVTFLQEVSAGGIIRLDNQDPGLIGGGNGGFGTSINFDDGNLNYDRGWVSFAVQGRTNFAASTQRTEAAIEAVYFYDFLNASGDTDFHDLTDQARDRVGRGLYLHDAYLGLKERMDDPRFSARAGNQRLRWSESPSFGHSISPLNPVAASRRYQPGNTARDLVVAVPMLSARVARESGWAISGFYQLSFEPSEPEAAGSFLSTNDYYSPGARYLQLGQGSPLVPDTDASVITPATPFGSKVPRGADRMPNDLGQFGVRLETPEFGGNAWGFAGYAMRIHTREPIVSVHTGTLDGLLGISAPDYTSSGHYFVEYPEGVNVVGLSAKTKLTASTRVNVEYSQRIRQPLQIDDEILIAAGLAPAAVTAVCAVPSSPQCVAVLSALNANPLIASRGGITPANAATFFDTELSGYERFGVSQWAASVTQGLPPRFGAVQWYATVEAGGIYVHGFQPDFLDAAVTIRPDESGARRNGLATRSAWGYRLFTRLEFANVLRLRVLAPSITWIHDVRGNAPITLGTLLEGNQSFIVATEATLRPSLTARISYRAWLGKGNDADRYSDRDFASFSLTRKF